MCGITGYWAKESLLSRLDYNILLGGASLRGGDGVGVAIYNPKTGADITSRWVGSYEDVRSRVLDFIEMHMELGSILIANLRATPETESMTTSVYMLQPINNIDCLLVHNGGVSDSVRQEVSRDYEFQTQIDSEILLAMYETKGRNLQVTMEHMVGSFAAIMIDKRKNKLYSITSFNPLSHGYIRGYGYILHSDNDVIGQLLHRLTGMSYDGLNVWESWYHHPLRGYSIIDTDLESGFQFNKGYEPRFLHPTWQPKPKSSEDKTKWLVCSSGGIDSGLTAYLLNYMGYDVEMLHFNYGQKSAAAELWAVTAQAESMGVGLKVFDLSTLMTQIGERGMLTNDDVPIDTGGQKIKSTIAWTCGRNLLFSSVMLARAEALIVENEYDNVGIAAGWAQLSEETGGYPDNSYKFGEALNEIKDYGLITGARIHFLPLLQRLTKTECWALGNALGFPFHLTVSCDHPTMVEGHPQLCTDCGSTKLSILAADRAGVQDNRQFVGPRPTLSTPMGIPSVKAICKRLVLPKGASFAYPYPL